MRKLFLIIIMVLLPWQYTWAMMASYDLHDAQDTELHFGHHKHPVIDNHTDITDLSGDEGTNKQPVKCHVHCGFLHLSFAVLSHNMPCFGCEANNYVSRYLLNNHSPPSYQPERPNWALLV